MWAWFRWICSEAYWRLMAEQFDSTSQAPVTWIFNNCNFIHTHTHAQTRQMEAMELYFSCLFLQIQLRTLSKFSIYMQHSLILMLKWSHGILSHLPSCLVHLSNECFIFKAKNAILFTHTLEVCLRFWKYMSVLRILNFLSNVVLYPFNSVLNTSPMFFICGTH